MSMTLFLLWLLLFVMWALEMRLSFVNHVSSPFVPISPSKQLRHKSVTCHTTLLENWNEAGGAECTWPGPTAVALVTAMLEARQGQLRFRL